MKLRLQLYLLLIIALLMSVTVISVQAESPDADLSSVVPTATLPPAILSTSGCTPTFEPWQTQTLLAGEKFSGRLYALQSSVDPHGINKVHRLIFSDDLGNHWSDFPKGLPLPSANVINIDVDDRNRNVLYVETEMHMSNQTWYGFYQWMGNQWSGRSSKQVSNVAMPAKIPNTIWGTRGTELVRSDDGGISWQLFGSNGHQLGELYADPLDGSTLYLMGNAAPSPLYRININGWQTLPSPNNNTPSSMAIDQQTGDLYVITQGTPATLSRTANARNAAVAQVSWEPVAHFNPEWQNVTLLSAANSRSGVVLFVNATLADGYARTYRSVGPLPQGVWQALLFP